MNSAQVKEKDYINCLIAKQKAQSGSTSERVQPNAVNLPADEAMTRLLYRMEPRSEVLWQSGQKYVS